MFFAFAPGPYPFARPLQAIFRHRNRRPRDYLLLFAGVIHERAVGEASVIYLCTPAAAQRIKKTLPDARLVVVLRNPVERGYSHYSYMTRLGPDRAPLCRCTDTRTCAGTEQKELPFSFIQKWAFMLPNCRLFSVVSCEQIQIYLYEDWNETPAVMLRDLFGFLEVDDGFLPEVETIRFRGNLKLCTPPSCARTACAVGHIPIVRTLCSCKT